MWADPRQWIVQSGFFHVVSENPVNAVFARSIVPIGLEENTPLIKTQEAPKILRSSFSHPRRGVKISVLQK